MPQCQRMFMYVDFEKVDIMLISYLIYYHKDSDLKNRKL